MRSATTDDFIEDLNLTVRELLTRGVSTRSIRLFTTRAIKSGPFVDESLAEGGAA